MITFRHANRTVAVCIAACLLVGVAAAQPASKRPVAALNAEAKALSEVNPEKSLAVAQEAARVARESRDRRGEGEALNFVAYGYRNQSLLELARRNAHESVRLFVEAGDTRGESQGYNTLGLIEADAGRFAEALDYHLKALDIRERTNDREGLAYSYNNLGNVLRNMGEFEKALEYHQQSLALKVKSGNRSSEAYSHHNIGLVHNAMGDHVSALAAYGRALAIREELKDVRGMGVLLNAIGQVEAISKPRASLRTFERALALRRKAGDERGEMATSINVGDVYRRLGDHNRASASYDRALALGERLDAPLMRSNALKALAELEAQRGNYESAYRRQLQHQDARDKMFNEENAARFQRLQVEHEADQQQRQIELLQQQGALREAELARVRTTRTALATIGALVLISLGLLFARYRFRQQAETRIRSQAEELAQALDELQTLNGLLPICAWCKKVREDDGYWTQVEAYVARHSKAEFTHCICPSCYDRTSQKVASMPSTRPA